ncbi:MAG: hypothetical protein NVSMB22_21030 [Chloroflexota bacterium]
MRKPLIALSLAASTGFGAIPVAGALAATSQNPYIAKGSTPPRTATGQVSGTGYVTSSPQPAVHSGNAVSGAAIVQTAMKYLGFPYTATGNSPSTGFSCIGFVSFVYRSNGIPLPGDLGSALAFAPQVPFSDLQPGDILYFQNTVWNGLSHAAIYIGGGRFVHAEWYNRGVVVSSFNKDPHDYDYWISKYLGANRPWSGAAVGPLISQPSSSVIASGAQNPTTSVAQPAQLQSGPSALVSVASLNVRQTPSKNSGVQQVVYKGTTMTILGKSHGWYKVQLTDGTVGWIVAAGIGKAPRASSSIVSPPAPSASGSNGVDPAVTVGNPVAPTHIQSPYKRHAVASVKVSSLRVRAEPSTYAQVVTTVPQGKRMVVLSRGNGWMKVRLADGTVGWVSTAYTSVSHAAKSQTHTTRIGDAAQVGITAGTTSKVAINLRSSPSMNGSVLTVVSAGAPYQVLGRSHGWVHVQLADGSVGWINAGAAAGASGTTGHAAHASLAGAKKGTASGAVLSFGVRVHARAGSRSAVVSYASAGTRVRVLGYSHGWVLIQLPSGASGYVSASAVR